MNYTAQQLEDHLYALAKGFQWEASGNVYHGGLRPRDSHLEDIIVSYVSGLAGDVQTAILYVNIYVPDIDPYGNGVFVQDMARTAALEGKAQEFAASLAGGQFKWELYGNIHTTEAIEIKQHAVVIPLQVSYCAESRF